MVSGYVYIHLAQRKAISVRPGQLPRHGGEGQQGHHRPGEGDVLELCTLAITLTLDILFMRDCDIAYARVLSLFVCV